MNIANKLSSRKPAQQRVWILIAALFISCGGGPALLPAQQPSPEDSEERREVQEAELLPSVDQAIVAQTNDFRQRNNQQPLSSDEQLTKAAEAFAKFMAINDKYGHRADGRTPAERAQASGYEYCVIRENIAFRRGSSLEDPDELTETFVQGWIDSDEHRANMLADYVTETGVAVATTDQTTFYAVQMFGRPESLRFKVKIINQTEQIQELTMEQGGNSDGFELPPRVRLTVTRCLPTNFVLNDEEQGLTLAESAELAIVANSDNEAALRRVGESPGE